MMSEEKPTYLLTDHEAKKRRIEAIKEILARYAAGEIGQEQATAEIEAITHAK